MSKRKTTRKRRWKLTSREAWPWWVVAGVAVAAFGSLGAILALTPEYSPVAMQAAFILTLLQVVAVLWRSRTMSWWSQMASANLAMLFFLGIGIRAWGAVVPDMKVWLPVVAVGYLLALALPALQPRLSEFLYREQLAPQTRLGRGCLTFSVAVLPAAGISGYWLYEVSERARRGEIAFLVGGALGIVTAIGLTQ